MSTPCIAPPQKKSISSSSRARLLRLYHECQKRYTAEGVWQNNYSLLRKVAFCVEEARLPVKGAMLAVAKLGRELMMNDLEIVGWWIYVTRFAKGTSSEQEANFLTFTGVAAKFFFNENVEILYAHFEKTLPDFTKTYNDWFESLGPLLHISPKELNDSFRELTAVECETPRQLVNYNSLVEDVLASTPHLMEEERSFPLVPIPVKAAARERLSDDPELPELPYQWSIGLSLEKLGSLTELWPDLQRRPSKFVTEARLGFD